MSSLMLKIKGTGVARDSTDGAIRELASREISAN